MKINYLTLFLTTAGIALGSLQALGSEEEIRNYLSTPIQKHQKETVFGDVVTEANLVENEAYKGHSVIYQHQGLAYPKMPRVHSYHHFPQNTYLGIDIPNKIFSPLSQELLNKIFKDVPENNRHMFFVIQDQSEFDVDGELLFRPHYYVDNQLQPGKSSETPISVALFPFAGSKVNLESKPEGSFFDAKIYTHPESGAEPGLIASPPNLKINKFDSAQGASFCSLTFVNKPGNPLERKAALTFHYLPPRGDVLNLEPINNVSDVFNILLPLETIENRLAHIAEKIENYQKVKALLPSDFNPDIYAAEHPELEAERQKIRADIDLPSYAEWQFANYGAKDGMHYLPRDFSPELYLKLRPGLSREWDNRPESMKDMDLLAYARWQYAHYGFKDNVPYLPDNFNAQVYIDINPGLAGEWARRPESMKDMDLLAYAKWQYAHYGSKYGTPYAAPDDFDSQVYIDINPGLAGEWARRPESMKDMDLLAYAKWQYVNYGVKDNVQYK